MTTQTKSPIAAAITKTLGYCCEWWFYSRFGRPSVIAARLGYHKRTIRARKAIALAEGCIHCEGNPRCMKKYLKAQRSLEA